MTDNVVPLPSTVKFPSAFTQSPSAGNDGHLHWEWWKYAIDRRDIKPMDIDGLVEIKNNFLICESKNPGVPIPKAQQDSINALLRTGLFTVIYQYGKETPQWWAQQGHAKARSPDFAGGLNPDRRSGGLFEFVKKWAQVVDAFHPEAWRARLIQAALHNAPEPIWTWLAVLMAKNSHRRMLPFAELPLWRAQIDQLEKLTQFLGPDPCP